jgi:hypothetical protein
MNHAKELVHQADIFKDKEIIINPVISAITDNKKPI